MVLCIMVPQLSAIGSGAVPPMPPTILMSVLLRFTYSCYLYNLTETEGDYRVEKLVIRPLYFNKTYLHSFGPKLYNF